MDNYLNIFCIADDSSTEIAEALKEISTAELKKLDERLKKDFQEMNFFFVSLTKEHELITVQLVSQYLRLISLIGLELLEREK